MCVCLPFLACLLPSRPLSVDERVFKHFTEIGRATAAHSESKLTAQLWRRREKLGAKAT